MTAMHQKLGLGFVGLGWPGEQHAIAAAAIPEAEITTACDLNADRREKFVEQFSPRKVCADYDEMLADPEVHVVVVSLPNFLHYAATLAALRAGKHVLCEKPPTMNVAEIEAIQRETYERGLVYSFSRQSRFSDKMLAAKRAIAEGRLGKVYHVRAERVRSRGIPVGIGGWFLEKAKAGGGAIIDLGVHAIDAGWYAIGCPRPVSVSAQVTTNFRRSLPVGVKCDVEDAGYAFIRFAGGITMQLEVTWAANVTDAIPISTWTGHELENTTFYGDEATLRLSPFTLFSMEGMERKETALSIEGKGMNAFERQMRNFLDAIRTGAPPISNVDQAVSLMKMLMAIYQSSDKGAEIRLDD
jgi:predicted dehydrogenase